MAIFPADPRATTALLKRSWPCRSGSDLDVILQEMAGGPEFLGRHHDLFHALVLRTKRSRGKADEQDGDEQQEMNDDLRPIELFFSGSGIRGIHQ